MQKYKTLITIASLIIILDQATKSIIINYLSLHQSIEVISGFFNIVHVRNPGAAFSIFRDINPTFRSFFLIGTSIAALVVIFFVYRSIKNNFISNIALSLIGGGAIGNLIDRIRLGEVIDFIDIYVNQYHWPAFNIADSAITIGVFLAIFFLNKDR